MLNKNELEKFKVLAKVVTTRVDRALNEVMAECVRDGQAVGLNLPEEALVFVSAGLVMATLLRHLRREGCPEEELQKILILVPELERSVVPPDLGAEGRA
jgi:hypothetical protein